MAEDQLDAYNLTRGILSKKSDKDNRTTSAHNFFEDKKEEFLKTKNKEAISKKQKLS
jgi:hypothetical protein